MIDRCDYQHYVDCEEDNYRYCADCGCKTEQWLDPADDLYECQDCFNVLHIDGELVEDNEDNCD